MPNARFLREIVVYLKGLVWKGRDAGSPAAGDVMQIAAKAVQDIAAVEGRATRPKQVTRRLGEG